MLLRTNNGQLRVNLKVRGQTCQNLAEVGRLAAHRLSSPPLPPFLDNLNKWLFHRAGAAVLYHPSRPLLIDSSDIPPKNYTHITNLPSELSLPLDKDKYPSEAEYTKALQQLPTSAEDENAGEAKPVKAFKQLPSLPQLPKFRFGQRLRHQPARLTKNVIDGTSASRGR